MGGFERSKQEGEKGLVDGGDNVRGTKFNQNYRHMNKLSGNLFLCKLIKSIS